MSSRIVIIQIQNQNQIMKPTNQKSFRVNSDFNKEIFDQMWNCCLKLEEDGHLVLGISKS